MQFLSIEGDYALRAVIYLSAQDQDKVTLVSEIAERQMVPVNFLFKILRKMVRAGLVKSFRGPRGGYALARNASEITVLQVVEAVEGPVVLNRCLNEPASCLLESGCKMMGAWQKLQDHMRDQLQNLTIAQITRAERGAAVPAARP